MHYVRNPMLPSELKFIRRLALAAWFLSLQIRCLLAASAPPANDLCAGAEVIPGSGPFPYASKIVDISRATTNGDPVLSPSNTDCYQIVSRSVWYRFTPAISDFYVLSVNDTATTVSDTLMAMYTSAGGCSGPFTPFACNDDAGFTQSAIATNLLSNTTYYVVVWKVLTNAPVAGETAVQLKVSRPQVPANDLCAGAEIIPAAGPFPYLTAITDTIRATTASDPPGPDCQTAGFRSIWYRFVPAASGDYVFTTVPFTATRVFDTLLAIYKSVTCAGPFTEVACNDDAVDLRAAVTTSLTAGTTYYIVVWDLEETNPGFSTLQLGISRLTVPTVTTLAASNVSSTSVVFNSSVTPNSDSQLTRVWFQWGLSSNYDNATTPLTISSNLVNVAVRQSAPVNPVANTLYHYRAAAGHNSGTNYGGDRTFLWSNVRPHIDAIGPQGSGSYRLQFTGNAFQLYQVQASSTLTNWVDLGAATDLGSGAFEFIDLDAGLFERSFYRLRAP